MWKEVVVAYFIYDSTTYVEVLKNTTKKLGHCLIRTQNFPNTKQDCQPITMFGYLVFKIHSK
jgi:hypothetical protein